MLFTVGHTLSYEQYFDECSGLKNQPMKKGKTSDYPGGSVWLTKKEALAYCPKDYSVYGVLADWNKDTKPSPEGNWNELLKTSKLIRL